MVAYGLIWRGNFFWILKLLNINRNILIQSVEKLSQRFFGIPGTEVESV